MDTMLIFIGLILLFLSLIPYFIYLFGIVFGKKMNSIPLITDYPGISIIISAYNEESVVKARIENIAAIHYPKDSYEVIFIDDCSDDNTLQIARSVFGTTGISFTIISNQQRMGTNKSYNKAFPCAKHPIIVTTDADVFFNPETLRILLSRLCSDDSIAAVCGELQPMTDTDAQTARLEHAYRSLYGRMCSWESAVDSTYNFNGALVAFKKDRITRINDKKGSDDANTAFEAIRRGFKAIYELHAVVFEEIPPDFRSQYRQKTRRATRLIEATCANFDLLRMNRAFCRFFYPMRIFMVLFSPLLFFIGTIILCGGLLIQYTLILVFFTILLVLLRAIRKNNVIEAFILNQWYLLVGLFQIGNDMKIWQSTSKKQTNVKR